MLTIAAATALVAATGCTSTQTTTCSSGVVCPAGTTCTADGKGCTDSLCGNGVVDSGEQCDDGNLDDTDDCTNKCMLASCGDNIVHMTTSGTAGADVVEACDPGSVGTETATCNNDCTTAVCGDGKTNTAHGEDCDTSGVDTGTCVGSTCKNSTCGDGHTNVNATPTPEQCDPPNDPTLPGYDPSKPQCSATCQNERCGNGVKDPGEACDNGGNNAGSGCYQCVSTETCGNGYVDTQLPDNATTNQACKQSDTPPGGGAKCAEICDPPNDPKLPGYDPTKPLCSRNCLSNMTCGNGIIDDDVNETCDPPNDPTLPGYDPTKPLCAANCVGEACGNNQIDPGEQCDAGAADTAACNGDSPAANGVGKECHVPICGDNYVNNAAGETCDPGPLNTGLNVNGFTPTCNINCSIAACGDGILNPLNTGATPGGELCDPGTGTTLTGLAAADGSHCNIDCTPVVCGDNKVNTVAGEQCDPGQIGKPSATCNSDCTTAVCGDGKVDPLSTAANPAGEQCDPGTGAGTGGKAAAPSATCNIDCTVSVCGDGKLDSVSEACDPGNGNGAACNENCTVARCGDGIFNPLYSGTDTGGKKEQCDLGTNNSDAPGTQCTTKCQLPQCGDGIVEGLEECDAGAANSDSGDCTTACRIAKCGDGLFDSTGTVHKEQCESNGVNSLGCNADCTTPRCGDGKVNPAYKGTDTGGKFETCDAGGQNSNSGDCTATCQVNVCGDGNQDTTGNNKEQCDLGASNSNTGDCTLACKTNVCGDGFVDTTAGKEACDPGTGVGGGGKASADSAFCNKDCTVAKCGDSKLNTVAGEQCDGGGLTAGCNINCTTAKCGDGIFDPLYSGTDTGGKLEQCDLGVMNSDSPGTTCTTKCQLPLCGDGIIEGAEECDNGAANNNNNDCTASCHIARCGDGLFDSAGTTHKEQCESGGADSLTCNRDCTTPKCGDGKLNLAYKGTDTGSAFEQCDNGGLNNNAADCTATCQFNYCGDGHQDNQVGPHKEGCDTGAANSNSGACTLACTVAACGDGNTETGVEQCDPGTGLGAGGKATNDSVFCDNDCTVSVCGDSHVNTVAGEACDDGGTTPGDGCSATCTVETNWHCTNPPFGKSTCYHCGDGVLDPGEACDDNNNVDGDGCHHDCTIEAGWTCLMPPVTPPASSCNDCGNNTVEGQETCDNGANDTLGCNGNSAPVGVACRVPSCGDGYTNTHYHGADTGNKDEKCDQGTNNGMVGGCCDAQCQFQAGHTSCP
jgi:cysteine-rich repeat protein